MGICGRNYLAVYGSNAHYKENEPSLYRTKNKRGQSRNRKISLVMEETNRYEVIKLLLSTAKMYYVTGRIAPEKYLKLLNDIERDFLEIQLQKQEEEITEIVNSYIAKYANS